MKKFLDKMRYIRKVIKEAAQDYDEELVKYKLTPKGIAYMAFLDNGIEIDDEKFDAFWNEFESNMEKLGYVE